MVNNRYAVAAVVLLGFFPSAFGQQFFTNRTAFLANLNGNYYEEPFNGWGPGVPLDGHQSEWEAPGANGFGWTASAPGNGNHQLYSLSNALSTSSGDDMLSFQFSGDPVYAFGGYFWGTDFGGSPVTATVEFQTDTGQFFSNTVSGPSFIGFLSGVPITSVTIHAFGAQNSWPTAGDVITGNLNPNGDIDGDGMTNSSEQLAGTDALDPKSNLHIIQTTYDGANFVVTFAAVAGKTYHLESKDVLTSAGWTSAGVPDQTPGVTGPAQFTVPLASPPPRRFFRVALVP